MNVAKIARRTFLIGAATVAGGVAVGYYYVRKPYANPLEENLGEGEAAFNPYVKIGQDNTITVITPRAEMGQGVHNTLAALVAEELEVGLDDIEVEHGPGDFAYFNGAMLEEGAPFAFFDESFLAEATRTFMRPIGKVLGLQVTGGSSSMIDAYDKMRQAGCAARHMLVSAAAKQWNISAKEIDTANKFLINTVTGEKLSYGSLATAAARIDLPGELKLKARENWRILGTSPDRVDIPSKVDGSAVYGIDIDLPDMVYATVRISPRFGAEAVNMDDTAALAVKGVEKVVPVQTTTGSGYGVIAENTWAAFKGAEALEIEWGEATYPKSSDALYSAIAKRLDSPADFSMRDDGDVDRAFADAPRDKLLEADYRVPYLAHACMEPMNATARWKDGVLDIWAPTQAPTVLQMTCAGLVGVNSEDVRVHATMLGGGFGRRIEVDFALYAVELAKQTNGRPVKVTWTREEDMRHDTYRPAMMARMRARIDNDGMPVAVDMHLAGQSVIASVLARTFPSVPPSGPDKSLVDGAFNQPYSIDNYKVSGSAVDLPVPVGFWRSVGNSCNAWFHESFIDEIAHMTGKDPLTLRLELMKAHPAALGVLRKVADMSGWGRELPAGRGLGLAHTLSFGTWVAMVVEVAVVDGEIRIENVWAACEIGRALDPENIKAQVMSAAIFGLSSAMGQEITFEDGEVVEGNFDEFDAMRMSQCPAFHIEILETYHKIGGAGEPGTPPSIPALVNAIFSATGKRIRTMPLTSEIDFVA